MQTPEQRRRRAERARRNGAMSKGPTTPEGLQRARTASLDHGLYATEETLAHLVDKEKFAELLRETAHLWVPENSHITQRLNHLVGTMWELNRLIEVRRTYVLEKVGDMPSVVDLELELSKEGDIVIRLDARIRRLGIELSRIERDILRLKKFFSNEGGSHKSLKTNPRLPWDAAYQQTPGFGENPAPDTATRT